MPIYQEDTSPNVLYNLVVRKSAEGIVSELFIVKYKASLSIASLTPDNYLDAKWAIKASWLHHLELSYKKSTKRLMVPALKVNANLKSPCSKQATSTASSSELGGSGGGGNGNAGNNGGGGGTYECTIRTQTIKHSCNGPNSDTPHPPGPNSGEPGDHSCGDASTGYGGSGKVVTIYINCDATKERDPYITASGVPTSSDADDKDCIEAPLLNDVGIFNRNEAIEQILSFYSHIANDKPSKTELYWIFNPKNNAELSKIIAYVNQNNKSTEAKDFAVEVIKARVSNNFNKIFENKIFNQQDPYDVWKKITQAERDLIKENPFKAYQVFKNRNIATQMTIKFFGYNGRNDKSDAFRHAFYQSINTRDVGISFTGKFGDAHESEVPEIIYIEKEMDLYNNEIGILLSSQYPNLTNQEYANEIYNKLKKGELRYLYPLNKVIPPYYGINSKTKLTATNQ